MRVSLDSNVWEEIFHPQWETRAGAKDLSVIRGALCRGVLRGYICDAAFRLEAIGRRARSDYLSKLRPSVVPIVSNGRVGLSIGPDDDVHRGLPQQQSSKFVAARQHHVKLMNALSWFSIPSATSEVLDAMRISETPIERRDREQLQIDVFYGLKERGVGYAQADKIRREYDRRFGYEHSGWTAFARASSPKEIDAVANAVAEWADAELIAAHVAYKNDLLCTSDMAKKVGESAFDGINREWLTSVYQVRFVSVAELASLPEYGRFF